MRKHLSLGLLSIAGALLLQPILSWATTNCYNNNPIPSSCLTNNYCLKQDGGPVYFCKQLTIPYVDPGCCSYTLNVIAFGSQNNGTCPCADKGPYNVISNAVNTPSYLCHKSDLTVAHCNTDTQGGVCTLDPTHSCI